MTEPKQGPLFKNGHFAYDVFLNAKYFITIISDETQIAAAIVSRKYIFLKFLLKCVQKVNTSILFECFPDFENISIRTIIKHKNYLGVFII